MMQDPAVAQVPSIEEVMAVLQSDAMRQFRVDIETSSTVAASIESDMSGLREVLTGLIEFWNGSGAAVQAGALPIEAVKAISLEVVRRSRMGLSVEDAIDQIKAPQPQAQPAEAQGAQPPQPDPSIQIKAQAEMQIAQMRVAQAEAETQAAIAKAQAEAEIVQLRLARERAKFQQEMTNAAMEVGDAAQPMGL